MLLRSLVLATTALVSAIALTACGGGGQSEATPPASLQQSADRAVSQGLAAIVIQHLDANDTTQARAGLRQVGSAVSLQPGDAFMIGSTTKAMTSALAGRLVERGVIAWTTTVAEALPDLAASMQPAYRTVTLEQLLSHRGGVLAFTTGEDIARFQAFLGTSATELPTTRAGRERFFAAWLLAQTPAARPGQDLLYSNAGYSLAALMLEVRTGLPFAELFQQELAQPLGLQVSWTSADASFTNRPVGHSGAKGRLTAITAEDPEVSRWLDVLSPAGLGTTTTPESYAAWVRWHLRALHGETTPLAAGYLQRIKALKTGDYGLGWLAADLDSSAVLLHDGEWRGFTSVLVVDAQGRSATFGFTNTEDTSWATPLLNQAVLDTERAMPPK
ncbi:serine hydrolase domain-containing protein [Roseateles sp.]|uniref:serine hydrolase domain-containing protein n=1 Tax=Roseateles sp. TaxID=1971397 RepID=UPI003267269F